MKGGILSGLLWSFLVVGAMVVAGLYVAGAFLTGVRVEHSDNGRGQTVKVETPLGSVRVQERSRLDPKHFGVPIYPGATLDHDNKAATVELDLGDDHKELTVVAAVYTTPDSVEDVRAFYRKNLPHWIISAKGMEYSEDGYKRTIVIQRRWGRTRIALASVGEPAAN